MSHNHHHHDLENMGDSRLLWAIAINMLLTLAQIIGGIISGSLSLIADALHNFSDAASLLIALVARKIGRKPADYFKSFGYKRAEIIATLINLVTLVIVGIYLIYEALWRLYEPQIIEGWMVVIVASVALIVDIITAILTYSMSKNSMNMRAAFLHNLSDALASVGVIVAGTLILMNEWYWSDTILTLIIAAYILYQAATLLPQTIHILMQGTPKNINIDDVTKKMQEIDGVIEIHHLHLWQLDEHKNALESHVVLENFNNVQEIKENLKQVLKEQFSIVHSTLEFEVQHCKDQYC
ncbi:MAG: cation diffusion facilitator family transporter [Sulfurimonas sp.]|uniref:cation diffusion facilitator family transporter n=1 Tax=Sulfurimonas sp. TaxID=2022749 RepID=UPI002618E785|nr:cation diffusion facilitator family transporter [Sulfurimonas sp.]MCW8894423.1 cation diffusion facilitator family transporter [Sulfurimonas sp.]MCW8953472.1 cation diffusion facilitator family transporter [Sulfurimonas sp.]MCW9067723.1 cation diffusion facilitator family transporter [Sulfurimonas sp.]